MGSGVVRVTFYLTVRHVFWFGFEREDACKTAKRNQALKPREWRRNRAHVCFEDHGTFLGLSASRTAWLMIVFF